MGDFNINVIHYGSQMGTQEYIDAMFQQQHIISYTDISDHLPIITKQINDTKVDTVIQTRIYNEQTTSTFKQSIDQITWDDIYAFRNPQESYSKFLNEN